MRMMTIAEARRLKNISQDEMAKAIGCSFSAYRCKEKYVTLMNSNEVADFLRKTGLDYKDVQFSRPNRVVKKTQKEVVL